MYERLKDSISSNTGESLSEIAKYGGKLEMKAAREAVLRPRSIGHQRVNKRPIYSLFPRTVLFGKLLCPGIIPGEIQRTSRGEIFCLTKQVTSDSIFPLLPSPSNPFLSLLPLPRATSYASLLHLCLHAWSSSRCIPELLNDAGISHGWQRLSSFKPFSPVEQCQSLI